MHAKNPYTICALLIAALVSSSPLPALAGGDAEVLSSNQFVGRINTVGDIWSAELPNEIQYEKSSTYPCGDLIITFKGLLPYAVLADKSRGVSINLDIWTDSGAKIAGGTLNEYEWNPVGPLTQEKLFICGKNVVGTHTLIVETIYETASNGLLSRYLSSTHKQNIKISIKKDPPAMMESFKVSWGTGYRLITNWSAPTSESEITGYQIGLFETTEATRNQDVDLSSTAKILETVSASTFTKDLNWGNFEKVSANSGTIYKLRIRALSSSGVGAWSNSYILEPADLQKYLVPITEKPPPPLFSVEINQADPTQVLVNLGSANFVSNINKYKVSGWVSKIKNERGVETIGTTGQINSPGNYRFTWTDAVPGKYLIAAAFINEIGQGDWSDFKEIEVPFPFLSSADKQTENIPKKKKTIICAKGKLTKKITSTTPKCPIGFRKK